MLASVPAVDEDKLKRLRLGKGLTQIELAQEAKVSPDTIVRWENGRGQKPHPSALKKLAGALGVSPGDLLED
jgi:transcriptional regulator with XRE-family HTH domain